MSTVLEQGVSHWEDLTAVVHLAVRDLDTKTLSVKVYKNYNPERPASSREVGALRTPFSQKAATDGHPVSFLDRLSPDLERQVMIGTLPLHMLREALIQNGFWDVDTPEVLPVAFECEPVKVVFSHDAE